MSHKQKQLFKTKIVPGKAGSGKLFEEKFVVNDGPVECLGITFENDKKRREYFLNKLCKKLKDPEFRKIEGLFLRRSFRKIPSSSCGTTRRSSAPGRIETWLDTK